MSTPINSATQATGVEPTDWVEFLRPWRDVGILSLADLHIADRLATLAGLDSDQQDVVLAVALAARAPRNGHVCLDLRTVADSARAETDVFGPDVLAARNHLLDTLPATPAAVDAWRQSIEASVLVALEGDSSDEALARPLVLNGYLLYLQRYRDYEAQVADQVRERSQSVGGTALSPRAEQLLEQMQLSTEQRAAVGRGVDRPFSVIVGGPGTGKTHTVAALLAVMLDEQPNLRIALAAPTGKAAARMGEAIGSAAGVVRNLELTGSDDLADQLLTIAAQPGTIHRLLGWMPGSAQFRHHRGNPLPHDVVIVDETSMVSLPMLAHLLDAVPATSRVVLVGDPGQLASVEAGSVLGDIAGPVVAAAANGEPLPTAEIAGCISVLLESRRFPSDSPVGRFAEAVRSGDAVRALEVLRSATTEQNVEASSTSAVDVVDDSPGRNEVSVAWCPQSVAEAAGAATVRAEALGSAVAVRDAAVAGDAAAALELLGAVRVLCAHRHGPFGVSRWNRQFDDWLGLGFNATEFTAGRPVMITRNDPVNDLFNGDLGVVVSAPDADGQAQLRVAFAAATGIRLLAPARLDQLDTVHAMTIHKSQGSEFDTVVVVMPPADSPLATRELLYTAVTRARHRVVLIGTEEALVAAIRTSVLRASGLAARIWN
jgi:exodeoxyribonuclease V alpha subunit